jgi:hypothetical protein
MVVQIIDQLVAALNVRRDSIEVLEEIRTIEMIGYSKNKWIFTI